MNRLKLSAFLIISAIVIISIVTVNICEDASANSNTNNEAKIGETYYATVSEALETADVGDTVIVLTDCTINGKVTVKTGITLLIPYSNEYDLDGTTDGRSMDTTTSKISGKDNLYLNMTISSSSVLDVYGKVIVGGILSRPFTFDYQGHTSADYSQITLNGTIVLNGESILNCYGFIKGTGQIQALSGSTVYEPFIVTDFVGGDCVYCQYNGGQSIFNRYALINIQTTYTIHYGSILNGLINLYAGNQYNKVTTTIVGTDSGLILLKNGSSLTSTYNSSNYVKSNWESNIWNDIGKKTVTITGGASTGSIILDIKGQHIDTASTVFSIPYNYDFILNDGTYDINNKYRILPGSNMTVSVDSILNINGTLNVYDGLYDHVFKDKYYPTTALLRDFGFNTIGGLIINGTLDINGNSTFTGVIQTTTSEAKVIVSQNASVSNLVTYYGVIDSYNGSSITNQTERTLSCQLYYTDGTLTTLSPGTTYNSVNSNTNILASYSYKDNVSKTSGTIDLNQTIYGTWESTTPPIHTEYTVTVIASPSKGGIVYPESQIAALGETVKITIMANDNYKVSNIKVDGKSVGAFNMYVLSDISADHKITVEFEYSEGTVTEYNSSTGYITETTTTIDGAITEEVKRITSPTNDMVIETTISNTNLNVETKSINSSSEESITATITVNTTISGETEKANISNDTIEEAIRQIKETVSKTGITDITPTISIKTNNSGSDVKETSVEISNDSMKSILNAESNIRIQSDKGTIVLDKEIVSSFSEKSTSVSITVGNVDKSDLNEKQQSAVGDNTIISLAAYSGVESIHELEGNATITIPYTLKEGEVPNNIVIWYLDDEGNITKIHADYDLISETVSFVTDHFSYYVVAFESPTGADSSEMMIYAAIAFVVIIVIGLIIYAINSRSN